MVIVRFDLQQQLIEVFMAKNYTEINQEQRQFGSAYRKASPDTMNAFLALHKAAMYEGELSIKHVAFRPVNF